MKVIKNYGVVACHGSKELRLQTIKEGQEKRLALVSYKDSMPMNVTDITAEAKTLKELLIQYLGIEEDTIPQPEPMRDIIKTLTSLPAGDVNYQTELRKATEEDLREAIEVMKNSDGKHATRIKMCENMLTKFAPKESATVVEFSKKVKSKALGGIHKTPPKKEEPKKTTTKKTKQPTAKVYQFPTEDKRPKIVKLETKGNCTYEECEEKLLKEMETFNDYNCQYVIKGLLELCKVDANFRNNVMIEEKTFGGFLEYMEKAARNGYAVTYGHVSWVGLDMSLCLAIDYYNAAPEKKDEPKKGKGKTQKGA